MNSTLLSPTKKMAKKAPSKNYFTQDTEDAIIAYNLSENFDERSRIYNNKINYAFFKLTQNIIHTFKFYYTEVEEIKDLQHEKPSKSLEFLLILSYDLKSANASIS